MVFNNNNLKYRIAFDTAKNIFMAIDATDESNVAYGITIEQAIVELKNKLN
ncbi:hypothetical protein ACWOFR_14835 [Carnobacterium gallinarum]|uniref:hypothetical protein n=1 Tax=Carnobacterium gallinarum TaxID=2749 RepID=UPI000A902327|nr:hypothetical protein [Carnobacterium gallinarum]